MRGKKYRVLLVLLGALTVAGCKTSRVGSDKAGDGRAAGGPTLTAAHAEGLVKARVKGIEHVYARPNANLSAYEKVLLAKWEPLDNHSILLSMPGHPRGHLITLATLLRIYGLRENLTSSMVTLMDSSARRASIASSQRNASAFQQVSLRLNI